MPLLQLAGYNRSRLRKSLSEKQGIIKEKKERAPDLGSFEIHELGM